MGRSGVKPRQEKRHSIGGFPSYARGKTEFFVSGGGVSLPSIWCIVRTVMNDVCMSEFFHLFPFPTIQVLQARDHRRYFFRLKKSTCVSVRDVKDKRQRRH